jgi:hypothetical protein
MTVEGAHAKGTETGSIVFSVDGRTILTRGGDDTVKREYPNRLLVLKTSDRIMQYGIFDHSKRRLLCERIWILFIQIRMRCLARMKSIS